MKALILAAGFGTRLRPITDHIPKALLPVCGIPMLRRHLDNCTAGGISGILVNAHHLARGLEEYCERSPVPFTLVHERGAIRGTGGALYHARDLLGGEEPFIVHNADIWSSIDVNGLMRRFETLDCVCALVVSPRGRDGGTVRYHGDSLEYAGIPGKSRESRGTVGGDFLGIALYRCGCLDYLSADDFSVIPVWSRLQRNGLSVRVLEVPGACWCDTGTPAGLLRMHCDTIDGTVHPAIPDWMRLDLTERFAVSRAAAAAGAEFPGERVWYEPAHAPRQATLSHAVIYRDVRIEPGASIAHAVVSPWGRIHAG